MPLHNGDKSIVHASLPGHISFPNKTPPKKQCTKGPPDNRRSSISCLSACYTPVLLRGHRTEQTGKSHLFLKPKHACLRKIPLVCQHPSGIRKQSNLNNRAPWNAYRIRLRNTDTIHHSSAILVVLIPLSYRTWKSIQTIESTLATSA